MAAVTPPSVISPTRPVMSKRRPRVGVIGAGPGGIAMGIQLAQGDYDFTIFERGDGFGGTWRNNTYPGCGV